MEGPALSFFAGERLMAAPLPCRAASPEYTPVSPFWRKDRLPDHSPSTTLRLGTKMPSPPHRAASPDYAPSSTWRDAMCREHTPVSRYWDAAGSPEYTPSTPAIREASPFYAPDSPEYTPVSTYWRRAAGSADYTPSSPPRRRRAFTPQSPRGAHAPSPDYIPSTPPPSPPVSDAESRTSLPRRHPY
ncbi:hypothetical protein QOZ80_3AG0247670 [Eleusine coracana subsp. coracana]|nr:hypothetical protein QOZ80_3AG0247670 [Eleusine coracana subsp. coracana]